jgi:hypothetical protein
MRTDIVDFGPDCGLLNSYGTDVKSLELSSWTQLKPASHTISCTYVVNMSCFLLKGTASLYHSGLFTKEGSLMFEDIFSLAFPFQCCFFRDVGSLAPQRLVFATLEHIERRISS